MSEEEGGGGGGHGGPVWLLTYCDLITLLVAFFVMMIAMSTINVDKAKKAMEKFEQPFGGGGESLLESGTSPIETHHIGTTERLVDLMEGGSSPFEGEDETEAPQKFNDSETMFRYIAGFINESGMSEFLDVEDIKVGCKIKIPVDDCFEKNSSVIKNGAQRIFAKLGAVLRIINGRVVVDTNLGVAAMKNKKLEKEIDLSVDRAAVLCNYLVSKEEVSPQRIAISGYHAADGGDRNTITVIIFKK